MPTTMANGIELNYELTGEGDHTIVWTHGIGGSLDYWEDVLPHFPQFRHLTYDVRGMGRSERLPGAVSLEVWAQDLAALMEAAEVPVGIIAGSSMGGAITQRFGIDFPRMTEGLLILSTSSRVGEMAEAAWMKRADETEAHDPCLAAAQRAVAAYNMDEELKGIEVPSLVLCGDADETTPPGGSVIISRCIPGAELAIFEGIGHAPLKEEPKAVTRTQEWLAQYL